MYGDLNLADPLFASALALSQFQYMASLLIERSVEGSRGVTGEAERSKETIIIGSYSNQSVRLQ